MARHLQGFCKQERENEEADWRMDGERERKEEILSTCAHSSGLWEKSTVCCGGAMLCCGFSLRETLTCEAGFSVWPHGTHPVTCLPLWRRAHPSRRKGVRGSTCPPESDLRSGNIHTGETQIRWKYYVQYTTVQYCLMVTLWINMVVPKKDLQGGKSCLFKQHFVSLL